VVRQIYGDDPDLLATVRWESTFVPLSRGKVYLLVAMFQKALNNSELTAIYCEQKRCFSASVNTIANLKNGLVDADGDGFPEIIGTNCIPGCYVSPFPELTTELYSIYKFVEGIGFVDYSAKAAKYYREHLLPKIEEARNKPEAKVAEFNRKYKGQGRPGFPLPPGQMESYKAMVQYAYDDYLRRVQGQKDAGLENALRWMESEYTRGWALETFARISNPIADQKLAEAARSKGSRFAGYAANLLELRGKLRAH
jgi:hypothetical protein